MPTINKIKFKFSLSEIKKYKNTDRKVKKKL